MFTLYRWIMIVPLIVAAVLFALANDAQISFTYSPYHPAIELPLYALGLGLFAVGLLIGMLTTWVSLGSVRAEKRSLKKKVKKLEKELNDSLAANENLKQDKEENDKPAQNLLRH